MPDLVAAGGWLRPDNRRLIALVGLVQVGLVALPALWLGEHAWALSAAALGLGLALFSVPRALLLLLFFNIVVPAEVLLALQLPGGLYPQEGLFLGVLVFALIDLFYRRGLSLRLTPADLPVLAFLAVSVFSALVGALLDNSHSQIVRDVRYPLYYAVFFLVTQFAEERDLVRRFLPVLLLAGLVVSAEYILEFAGAIDRSTGTDFTRVAGLHGLILPIALLFAVNYLLYNCGPYPRWLLFAYLLPTGLALVLTMRRGMWVAFALGLVTSMWLHHLSQPPERRRLGRTLLSIFGIVALLVGTAFFFQRLTGASIGAHALARSRTFIEYEDSVNLASRFFGYAAALQKVARHPVVGNGQGATLTYLNFNPELGRFETWTTLSLDSLYLSLLLKMGVLGLVTFGWMGWRVWGLARRAFAHSADLAQRAFMGGMIAALAGMAVMGLSDGALINGRFTLVFGIFFGLVALAGRAKPAGAAA